MKYFFHKHIEIITFLSPILKKYDLFNRTSIHIVFLLFPLSIFVKISPLSTIYIREEKYMTTPILIGRGSQTFLVRQLCSYSENWVLGAVDKVLWWENVWNNFGMNNIQRIKRKCHFVNNSSMIKCGQQLIALVHIEYITLPALKKFWSRIVTIANYWTSDTLFQKTFSFSTLFNRWETLTDQNNAVWRQHNTVGNIFRDMFG
jgi:hypothetical protein